MAKERQPLILEGYERWFSIPGALPDHVAPDEEDWYISAEAFYQESLVEVPKLLAEVQGYRNALDGIANVPAVGPLIEAVKRHDETWGGSSSQRCRHNGEGNQQCCVRFHLAALASPGGEA